MSPDPSSALSATAEHLYHGDPAPRSKAGPGATVVQMLWLLPVAVVCAWWINDLRHQWASLVEYHFGWIVVMLVLYLVLKRWPTRPLLDEPASFGPNLLIAAAGSVCVAIGELYRIGIARTPSSSMSLSIGCALFVAAMVRAIHGQRTLRHFLFPLLFFFIAVPIPKILWNPVVLGLQTFVAILNVETLGLLGIPAQRHAHVIQLPNATVGVDEACSGVRSLQSSIMAALFVGDLMLRRNGWKFFFASSGIVLAVAGNFVRSLYLSATAYRHGTDALKAIHDAAGMGELAFTVCALVPLVMLACRLETLVTLGTEGSTEETIEEPAEEP
jgi:exosortase